MYLNGGICLRDGHIHTPFCPHGSDDAFESYIEHAIELGYTEISFTEHAPLPQTFTDPTPYQDSAMRLSDLDRYFYILSELKEQYKKKIKINIGLEIDYIIGFEEETNRLLEKVGPYLDDSILSVHFLRKKGRYFCLDYSTDMFKQMIEVFGSIIAVYDAYYSTLLRSITANLGPYKPRRIGHITLIHKFQKQFPNPDPRGIKQRIAHILDEMKKQGYELDYNGAGVNKPLCLEPYPPNWVIEEAVKRDIPIVYGSDAHAAKDLNQGKNKMVKSVFSV